ncbi:NAD(+)/NADH kinase [Anaerolineales bacterium HSG6]|nr:NAD(+)/NADH kinase [Anaerolineales bacterium HSG6]MDM8530610.1 NAD(+)/NADH kinase [Anaerolineales bacterium HSG25]
MINRNNQTGKNLISKNVGVLYHPKLAESRVMAAEILEFIEDFGVSAWVSSSWDEASVGDRLQDSDMIITLGGDGSMLRAARMTTRYTLPILGINMGTLGFLTEVQPAEWPECIEQTLQGNYWIEKRMMVQVKHNHQQHEVAVYEALNEVVIGRGRMARVVRLHTKINKGYLTTYTADALIISTATGSTAYSLAAGGPILSPELENIILMPLAPHLSLDRALILPRSTVLQIQIQTDHTALMTIDGQFEIEIADGDILTLTASPWMGRFVRLHEQNYFYSTLLNRLGGPQ